MIISAIHKVTKRIRWRCLNCRAELTPDVSFCCKRAQLTRLRMISYSLEPMANLWLASASAGRT